MALRLRRDIAAVIADAGAVSCAAENWCGWRSGSLASC